MRAFVVAAVLLLACTSQAGAQIEFMPEGARAPVKTKRAKTRPAAAVLSPAPSPATPAAAPAASPTKPPPPAPKVQTVVSQPMQVYIVRSAVQGCEPNCLEWISAQGKIEENTHHALRKVLARLGKRKLPIFIDSSGGSVEAALAMGRLIRARGLDVSVMGTEFVSCDQAVNDCKSAKAKGVKLGLPVTKSSRCGSACVFVLAGGTRRFVGNNSLVGVHRLTAHQMNVRRTYRVQQQPFWSTSKPKRTLISEKILSTSSRQLDAGDKAYVKIRAYFAEMGIDDTIMLLVLSASNDSIRVLDLAELQATRLATDLIELPQPSPANASSSALPTDQTGQPQFPFLLPRVDDAAKAADDVITPSASAP